ncbi:MAG: acyl carrier protein [Paenibacillus dendritiformis]|uniref:acyl carrier protein n=1 Tax=Paenibacillus dendritiformis TaxID=130049 RepID=UPI00143DA6BF|nr:acyl carrier protein [Paenibacillus dendritiformis]MDU5145889.1 acyl carrier protein [Paenibacillus dendritiformis]NKI21922.1 acyl carrier protein [Paenibacillus dendritiformis]NRF97452.1 acyl carrier protein [Paenibacillus dendritiformis]GIO71158.1 hypothetical protein J27TS7_06720 [Paenibacillus dendritiformis]
MTTQNIKEIVKNIVSEIAEVNHFGDDTNFVDELHIDSVMIIEVIFRLEKELKITIPESHVHRFLDLNSAVLTVQEIMEGN